MSILSQNDYYCITTMMDKNGEVLLWYIDIIEEQGINDEVPFFYDLYLDLVVYPNGEIIVDDMDELEDALANGIISQKQFDLAIETSKKLKCGMLENIDNFKDFTSKCYNELVKK